MFSFTRLGGADPLIGVEMASTGEVACFGETKHEAFLKSLISAGFKMPKKNILVSVQAKMLPNFVHQAHRLVEMGYVLYATKETHRALSIVDIPSVLLDFPLEARGEPESNVVHWLQNDKIDLVINLPNSESSQPENNYMIRRTAVDFSVPLLTNVSLVELFVEAMSLHHEQPMLGLRPGSLFDYYEAEPEEEAWTAPNEFH
jgi:carbamoyl-phosphate synthase (ammonia)